jgi:nitric oxide reductase subunit B
MTDERSHAASLSTWWRHGAILVMIVGFTILSIVTVETYDNAPPIAARVVDGAGHTIFTGDDVLRGQEVFLKYGLMEHGTLWGHGAYLGPDYTAEYLHRLAEISRDTLAMAQHGKPYSALEPGIARDIGEAVRTEAKENRYDPATETLRFSPAEAAAFATQQREWGEYFGGATGAPGLPPRYIANRTELDALAAYFAWATWATVANRPGKDYSYTNNWPYEPLVGNVPTASTYLWSALSLVTLLGGLGLILLAFGKFDYLGWRGEGDPGHRHDNRLMDWQLTPSQRATRFFLAVVAVLFLLQTLAGGALAHYRVEPGAFYGFDLARWLPYNLLRTWHLQLAIFWIATAWVAGGLFLAPLVGGAEPPGQRVGVLVLLGALALVVGGSLFGEWLGINDRLGSLWFWLGHQGSEYLDLGRFWQLLLAAGLLFWLVLMFRALRPAMRRPHDGDLASLFLYAAVAIPVFYLPALFYGPHTNFAVIDNWRFWIIHLWVEGFFELFATVLVAVMFFQMGLVAARTATRIVYLDAILYLGAGIVGTGHHWYFTGQGTLNMGLAACFSAMEVVPLTLLTLDAWDFVSLQDRRCAECGHAFAARQTWAIYFLMAVGFWNFVGAGIFGFLINLPIVSYFEVGTLLTSNHGHTAMFGVFGMLALAVVVFCLRAFADDGRWQRVEGLIRTGFWGVNVGLGLMVLLDLFPGGVLQLWDSLSNGYWHARRLAFLTSGTFHMLEWARIGADMVFLVIGVVPIVVATLRITLSPVSAEASPTVATGGRAKAVA